jgi:hypothetical protein
MTLKYVAVNLIYSDWYDAISLKLKLQGAFETLDQGLRSESHQMYTWDPSLLGAPDSMALAVNVEVWDSQDLYTEYDTAFQSLFYQWLGAQDDGPLSELFGIFVSLAGDGTDPHSGTRCYKGLAYVPDGIGAETRMRIDFLAGETDEGIGVYGDYSNNLLASYPNFQWDRAITVPTNDLVVDGASVYEVNVDQSAILLHFDNTDPLGVLVSHNSPPPPPPPTPCQDEGPFRITWDGSQRSCEYWQSYGLCEDTYVIDRCPVTCGACTP